MQPPDNNSSIALSLLDRRMVISKDGLPSTIAANGREILASPITVQLLGRNEAPARFATHELRLLDAGPGAARWESHWSSASLSLDLKSELGADGFCDVAIDITAKAATELSNIVLQVPLSEPRFFMGTQKRLLLNWKFDEIPK